MTPIDPCDLGQSLAEDLAGTRGVAAAKPAGVYPQLDRDALPGKVLEPTAIAAVTGSRHDAAERAHRLLFNVDHQSESVRFSFDAVQYQDARVGEEGLRMARGSCHRPHSLKHS